LIIFPVAVDIHNNTLYINTNSITIPYNLAVIEREGVGEGKR